MKYESKKIYIGKSKLHGKGLFASKKIKKGEKVFIITGKKINFLITDIKKAEVAGLNWIGVGKNEWIDPKGEYGTYFNHSCNPNVVIKNKIDVVALFDINKDEEITFDYSTTEADIFWSMECYCDQENCRKVIKSVQFLPDNFFAKHRSHMDKHYKKIYNKFNFKKFNKFNELKKSWVDFLIND